MNIERKHDTGDEVCGNTEYEPTGIFAKSYRELDDDIDRIMDAWLLNH